MGNKDDFYAGGGGGGRNLGEFVRRLFLSYNHNLNAVTRLLFSCECI